MLRQISHKNLKMKSRQKSKTPSRLSQSKYHLQQRSSKVQTVKDHHINHPLNPPGNHSKAKVQKNSSEKCKAKPSTHQKNQPDTHALHMKGNLKQLMSKNMTQKPKANEVVPQLLKNIEKHCKELRKINDKQKCYQKRISLQENKLEKEKKWGMGNKSQDYQYKKKNEGSKERTDKEMGQTIDNRLSLQMNPQSQLKSKTGPMTNERLCKKSVEHEVNDKNFIEIFKIYKKSFEIEDLKIEKSNKNTNYNTNQSKNSSSIFNSAHGDLTNRNKLKTQDKINFYKIQNLIKSQQRSISKDNSVQHKQLDINTKINLNPFDIYHGEVKASSMENSEQKVNINNESLQIHQESKHEVQMFDQLELKESLLSRERSPESQKRSLMRQQGKVSNISSCLKSHEVSYDKDLLEKKFESSKFYVQPIPQFRPTCQKASKEEDSLVGCEITLIENNVIYEDSELLSLEL